MSTLGREQDEADRAMREWKARDGRAMTKTEVIGELRRALTIPYTKGVTIVSTDAVRDTLILLGTDNKEE
jgi:hypothetical protein